MNRDDFMEFFRDDEKLNTLSTDDRMEIFKQSVVGSSDLSYGLFMELCADYDVCIESLRAKEINTQVIEGELRDGIHKPIRTKAVLNNGKLNIEFDGYGDYSSEDGYGSPLMIDYFEGNLSLVVHGDINQEEPTHIINLKDALESKRTIDYPPVTP